MKKILLGVMMVLIGGCTRNVGEAKRCAPGAAKGMGFEIVGYEGYKWNMAYGGFAWYVLRKVPDNGVLYEAEFSPWGGECHVYGLKAIDAIKPE